MVGLDATVDADSGLDFRWSNPTNGYILIQSATDECVTAIDGISQTIRDISTFTATIAAAVEEQDSATQEIARSVRQAAAGTREVSQNVAGASQAAEQSRQLAESVMAGSSDLSRQARSLSESVDGFLGGLRDAA